MAKDVINSSLGLLLRELLKERSLSMRKLSELSKIDTATISRVINGKRKANLQHLERFADCLEVPLVGLVEAAGYPIEQKQEEFLLKNHTYTDSIHEVFVSSDVANQNVSEAVIEQKLAKYQQYVQTVEGKNDILTGFGKKLESVASIGPLISQMKDLFKKFRLGKGTQSELAIIGSALLYFIIPLDAIPDYLFAIGYLDDAIAVQLASNSIGRTNIE